MNNYLNLFILLYWWDLIVKFFDLLSSEFSKENQIIIRMLFINIVGLQLMNVWMDGQFNKSLTGILSFYLSNNWKP